MFISYRCPNQSAVISKITSSFCVISSSCSYINRPSHLYHRYGVDSVIQAETCPILVYYYDSTCSILLHSNFNNWIGVGANLTLYLRKFDSGSAKCLYVLPRWKGRERRKVLWSVQRWVGWFSVFWSVCCRSSPWWNLSQCHMLVSLIDWLIDWHVCVLVYCPKSWSSLKWGDPFN